MAAESWRANFSLPIITDALRADITGNLLRTFFRIDIDLTAGHTGAVTEMFSS